jgi:hypothetical protein
MVACHFLETTCGPSSEWWDVSKLPGRVWRDPILRWLLFIHPNRSNKHVLFGLVWFIYSLIHMCIHCLGHLFPTALHLLPLPPTHLTSRQNLFCPLTCIVFFFLTMTLTSIFVCTELYFSFLITVLKVVFISQYMHLFFFKTRYSYTHYCKN